MTDESAPDDGPKTLSSLENAFDIIECMFQREVVGVSELAERLDMPKSTVHIYLSTLEERGIVLKEDGRYRLSFRFLRFGGGTRNRLKLFQVAKQEVDKLADETGQVANLGVEENGQRVLLYKSEVPDAIHDNAPIGEYTNMHWTALGKAILAYLPRSRVERIVDVHGLPRANEHTITTAEGLFEELEEVRKRGYSVEDQDRRHGVLTIAAPIFDRSTDSVISAVSVSGPRNRLLEDGVHSEMVDSVKNSANVIELRYTHY